MRFVQIAAATLRETTLVPQKAASVIARRAKPDVAIQSAVDLIDSLDCFASLHSQLCVGDVLEIGVGGRPFAMWPA